MPASRIGNRLSVIVKFWLPVLLWMGLIFYLSSIPGKKIPPLFPFQDILAHLIIYAILAYFFSRALKNTYLRLSLSIVVYLAVIFGFVYGLTDEFHQIFVPGRSASGFDLFVDSIGSFLGGLIQPILNASYRLARR